MFHVASVPVAAMGAFLLVVRPGTTIQGMTGRHHPVTVHSSGDAAVMFGLLFLGMAVFLHLVGRRLAKD